MYNFLLVALSYLTPLIPIILQHSLPIKFSDLLEGAASAFLAAFLATQQHKFSTPDQVLLLYLLGAFLRPLLTATLTFDSLYSLFDDNIYTVATTKFTLAGVVFVFGEKAFLATVQRSNDNPATYGYFGALDRRLGWCGEWGFNVWASCLGRSPSIAEASPPPAYMFLQQSHVPFIPPSPKRLEMV